jgi:hypothetical protein
LPDEKEFVIKGINCATDSCMVIPFNLKIGEGRLKATNAALLAKSGDNYYFYYDDEYNDEKPYFEYEGDILGANVILLTKKDAENAYIFDEKLYISDRPLFEKNGDIYMLMGETEEKVHLYEADGEPVDIYVLEPEEHAVPKAEFVECDKVAADEVIGIAKRYTNENLPEGCRVYQINFNMKQVEALNDIYLNIDFNGDRAYLFSEGILLTDWFSNGADWSVALKRYGYPEKMELVVCPFVEGFYYDLPPKKGCELVSVSAEAQYQVMV